MAKVCSATCHTQIPHTQQHGKIDLTGFFSHVSVSSWKRMSNKMHSVCSVVNSDHHHPCGPETVLSDATNALVRP